MAYTFKGGIHVKEYKNTEKCPIEMLPAPKTVSIPLSQHIGAPASPVVSVGDEVAIGQKIADTDADKLGCPIHASVSGKVVDIVKKTVPTGALVEYIVIENDFADRVCESVAPPAVPYTEMSTDEIISVIREAGISGMGGAAFPTYAKIRSAVGKADTIIINCAECEPFITANHRLLLEEPELVIDGARILRKALDVKDVFIAVEDNKMDAVLNLRRNISAGDGIEVKVMKTKYPQGDERQLIYALKHVEIPTGKLPADVGCVLFNAETCASVSRAFASGMPSVARVVTVDGDCVVTPKNIRVPIGTSVGDIIAFCGGLKKTPHRLISGGPMMGIAQWDKEMSVTKSTSAILLFSENFGKKKIKASACIHCGKCVRNCPMHVMPMYIAQFSQAGEYARAEEYGAMSCVECGSCSYNCPGGVEIVQYIRLAKAAIRAEKARVASQSDGKR